MLRQMKIGILLLAAGIILTGCAGGEKNTKEKDKSNTTQTGEQSNSEGKEEQEVDEGNNQESKDKGEPIMIIKENPIVTEFTLDSHDSTRMEQADGWTNGHMFDCTWRAGNVTFDEGIMKLHIDSDGTNTSPKWSGGEYRTKNFYHYGLYEVSMKPIKNDGVVSSFFTYTGPSDNNPWDEIDIEFLGKDTTKIQFNYFTNGVGNHEYVHDLGFDASEEFHTYGFEWLPDSITWYVDGEEVHKATESIPSTKSKLMMNTWPGVGVDSWLKAFDGTVPLSAEYDWFKITEYGVE